MFHVVLFYNYCQPPLVDVEAVQEEERKLCESLHLSGRILLAREGINATLSSKSSEDLEKYLSHLSAHGSFQLKDSDFKRSTASVQPFPDLTVKLVNEIVSTGHQVEAPLRTGDGGVHLSPHEFHDMMTHEDDTVLVDVRNHKEYLVGHFENAVSGGLAHTSEFPEWLRSQAPGWRDKKVMMYCTGGIRCEKASKHLKNLGVDSVYQLSGGIHKYLEAFDDGGKWQGKNFVFDRRVYQDCPVAMPEERRTIAQCYKCEKRFDTIDGSAVCTVCLKWVIICPSCREETFFQYHCHRHRHLSEMYFTRLDGFTELELLDQRRKLAALLSQCESQDKARGEMKRNRRKRRLLHKQIRKIDEDVKSRHALNLEPTESKDVHRVFCRTCKSVECSGDCWGYWSVGRERTPGQDKAVEIGKVRALKVAQRLQMKCQSPELREDTCSLPQDLKA